MVVLVRPRVWQNQTKHLEKLATSLDKLSNGQFSQKISFCTDLTANLILSGASAVEKEQFF